MARISLVKGGQIRAGGTKKLSDGSEVKYGAGSFVPYDKKTKSYDTKKAERLANPKGVKNTAKQIVDDYQATYEPTVVTDTTIREDVIPDLNERINKMTETGQYTDGVGNKRNADGSIVEEDERDELASSLQDSADRDSDQSFAILKQLQAKTDADTARSIAAIRAQADIRKKQIEASTEREERATDTALLMGGSSRYATSSSGISEAVSRAGVMELAELDAKEQATIAEVKAAQSAQDYKLAEEKLKLLEERRQEKLDKAADIAAQMAEENELLRKDAERKEAEIGIADQLKLGLTDPVDIFSALGGKVPFDTILKITKDMPGLKGGDPFTLGSADIRFDAKGNIIARGAKVGGGVGVMGEGGGSGLGGYGLGGGGSLSADDEAWKVLDFNSKVGSITKAVYGANASDTDRERIEAMVRAGDKLGLDRQALIDKLSGWEVKNNQGVGTELKNILLSIAGEKGLSEFNPTGIADLLNKGNVTQAVQRVENAVYDRGRIEQADDFISETNVRTASTQVKNLRTYLDDLVEGGDTGIFDGSDNEDLPIGEVKGTIHTWLGRFKGPDAAAINNQVTNIVAKMRNDLLGSAVTESEKLFLDPIIPNLTDNPKVFFDKLNALETNPLLRLNSLRAVYNLPQLDSSTLHSPQGRTSLYQKIGEGKLNDRYQTTTNADLIRDITGSGNPLDSVPENDADFWEQFGNGTLQTPPSSWAL